MPSQMAPPAIGAHGTCPACHTLDTPLHRDNAQDARTQAILSDVHHGFLQCRRGNTEILPEVGHKRFLQNSFQFISHHIYDVS
jgi:hypothetical protein